MSKNYNPASFHTLLQWVEYCKGEPVSSRQAAFITCDSSYTSRFYRQHVTKTGSGTLLIENALKYFPGNPEFKVYFNALVPTTTGVNFVTLDRRRPGHYIYASEVDSVPWLATSSLSPF